jgi:hypothetical protein
MTLDEAIDLEVARTGNPRFRFLCSDLNPDVESRDAYRAHMLERAGVPIPPAPIPAPSPPPDPWNDLILSCPDYNPGCCASPAPFCSRFLVTPTREQCISCLESSDA